MKGPAADVQTAAKRATSAAWSPRQRIRVWDLPLRIFHWALVVAVSTAVTTGELGGKWMELHSKAGLSILGLVVFRIVWGLIGSTHARFARFAPTPRTLRAYVLGRWKGVGHNPLGALSVFALLALLAVQASTGLFSRDDIEFTGPLSPLIDDSLASTLTGWHQQLANVLLVLTAVHVIAIAFYAVWKKNNLVKPMVTGWTDLDAGEPSEPEPRKGGLLAFFVAAGVALASVYVVSVVLPAKPAPAATSAPAW